MGSPSGTFALTVVLYYVTRAPEAEPRLGGRKAAAVPFMLL